MPIRLKESKPLNKQDNSPADTYTDNCFRFCTDIHLKNLSNFAYLPTEREMEIITKFIIATEQGRSIVATLAKEIAAEKFASLVEPQQLEDYIEKKFNDKNLIAEMNSMSNQWLVVYVGDTPAGYAYITSNGRKPKNQKETRMMRIADFGILEQYNDKATRLSLLEKCIAISKSYNGLWIHEYKENPLIAFFESEGFVMHNEVYQYEELPLSSVFLTRNNL